MDISQLRELLRDPIVALHTAGHAQLPDICRKLGLPSPDDGGSRYERMKASFDAASDDDLPRIAQEFLSRHAPRASIRNPIQDVLWSGLSTPEIPRRIRRDVAKAIGHSTHLDPSALSQLLEGLWDLDQCDQSGSFDWTTDNSLRGRIHQHVFRNDDWSAESLFEEIGAFTASDRRFALFLEGLASSEVRPDETSQREFVERVNTALRPAPVELRETGADGGYPVFTIVSMHAGGAGRPKNLIFASAVKPDLRFRDAVNNDIEIVTNADKVLVYDRPIGLEGLRWRDLQLWWGEQNSITDAEEAKRSLYHRLRESLPEESPPQRLLFQTFYRHYHENVPELPALLPEVWLHWDPKTVQERGPDRLARFRMDFLLLLPGYVRVVVEVDGRQHYANAGAADPTKYASLVAADRELKLSGYEVFRFGAAELHGEAGRRQVAEFFDALFKRYSATPGT